MALRDYLKSATAIPAISATHSPRIARIAGIAVASPINQTDEEPPLEAGSEARRQKVLAVLDAKPGITRAMVTDDEAEPDFVIITVAIRDVGTADIKVPRKSYDPFAMLELLARHNGEQVH